MKYSQEFLGTRLDITLIDNKDSNKIIDDCFTLVKQFENKYSRFIKGNILDVLNRDKNSQVDGELLSLLRLCHKVSILTEGYFDITVRSLLENMGYGIDTQLQSENIGFQNIEIKNDQVLLHNGVTIDLGSVGKGYLIDKIFNTLDTNFDNFIVDFGGDIRIKGKHTLYLEDPEDPDKVIGKIDLDSISIASSSGKKRKIKGGHHLINPKNKKSQDDKIAVYVTHKLASISDIFSTALFVTPLEKSLQVLQSVPGLEGMIIAHNGEIFKTKNFNPELHMPG